MFSTRPSHLTFPGVAGNGGDNGDPNGSVRKALPSSHSWRCGRRTGFDDMRNPRSAKDATAMLSSAGAHA